MKNKGTFMPGIVLTLVGAFLLFDGNLLGDKTIDVAKIVGIVGLILVAVSTPKRPKNRRAEPRF